MSGFYVTIGGQPVYQQAPAAATQHVDDRAGATAWEEGWQREATRVSAPAGSLLLILVVALVLRCARKRIRDKRNL